MQKPVTILRSEQFDDVYFSVEGGLAESRVVFLAGCGLPDAWRGRETFTVLETGFGTGLNFLATWQAWRADPHRSARLNFVSVEAFALQRSVLADALHAFPELTEFVDLLAAAYPERGPAEGAHRWTFDDGAVSLTLLVGEAADMLSRARLKADAVYLDGFSPAKNPEMWRAEVLAAVARLCHSTTQLATFTVARAVRDGLSDVGFAVERVKGFAAKRHRLEAIYRGPASDLDVAPLPASRQISSERPVTIVGAGIAGATIAHALIQRGRNVRVVDAGPGPASGASGNPAAAVLPRLTVDPTAASGRLHAACWHFFHDWVRGLPGGLWEAIGGVMLAHGPEQRDRLRKLENSPLLSAGQMIYLPASDLAARTGVPDDAAQNGGLYIPQAGRLMAAQTCQWLLRDVTVKYEWQATAQDIRELAQGGDVIVASAMGVADLIPQAALPVAPRRGQITRLTGPEEGPSCAVSAKGYLLPLGMGEWLTGATFDHIAEMAPPGTSEPVVVEDHARNVRGMARDIPGWAVTDSLSVTDGRAAIRCTTPDRLPMAGPVMNDADYREAFASVRHGPTHADLAAAPILPGVHVLAGLGSHGFLTAPLMAELLASELTGEPSPLTADLRAAVHPARFALRALQKGK